MRGAPVDDVSRFSGPVLVTYGDAGPAWLPQIAMTVAERIGCPTVRIPGAGHTPHHTHPEALAAIIDAHAPRGSSEQRGLVAASHTT